MTTAFAWLLVPGATPVAVRPYRYSATQKDGIERQCTDMLESGLIRRSTSEFSSPVLRPEERRLLAFLRQLPRPDRQHLQDIYHDGFNKLF